MFLAGSSPAASAHTIIRQQLAMELQPVGKWSISILCLCTSIHFQLSGSLLSAEELQAQEAALAKRLRAHRA